MLDTEKNIRDSIHFLFDLPKTDLVVSSRLTDILSALEQMGHSHAVSRHVIDNMLEDGSLQLVLSPKKETI